MMLTGMVTLWYLLLMSVSLPVYLSTGIHLKCNRKFIPVVIFILFVSKSQICHVFLCRLTDEEYTRYALSEGKRFQDSFEIIALLKKSYEAYKNMKANRLASYCGFQMAREHYNLSEYDNAIQLFSEVANLYRQEGWIDLLWEVLGYLRECSRKVGSVQGFIEYSLEMAALPVSTIAGPRSFKDCGPAGPATLPQREVIHKEVFGLIREDSEIPSSKDNSILQISGDCPVHLEIDLVSPLRVVLLASVAFHEHIVKPDAPTSITMSLLSQLPHTVEIDQLEIQFNQSECNFIIVNGQRLQSAAISNIQPGHRVETAPCLSLATNKWLRLTYDIKSGMGSYILLLAHCQLYVFLKYKDKDKKKT